MSKEQYNNWKSKIKQTNINRKSKHVYHPETFENKCVPEKELQFWLNKGFILGQYNKNRKSTKGMKKVCLPSKNAKQVWIRPEQLEEYLNNGYVLWKNRPK